LGAGKELLRDRRSLFYSESNVLHHLGPGLDVGRGFLGVKLQRFWREIHLDRFTEKEYE
jgi:hypothetical protein